MSTRIRTLRAGVLLLLLSCSLTGLAEAQETCEAPPADMKRAKALALYAQGLFYFDGAAGKADASKASGLFAEAVALDPDSVLPRQALVKALMQSGDERGALAQQLELARRTGGNPSYWKDAAFLALSVGSGGAFKECIGTLYAFTAAELKAAEMGTAYVRALEIVGWAQLGDFEKALRCFIVFAEEEKADIAARRGDASAVLESILRAVAEKVAGRPEGREVIWAFADALKPHLKDNKSVFRLYMLLANSFSQASEPDAALISALCLRALEADPLNYRTVLGVVFPVELPGATLDVKARAEAVARHPRSETLDLPFAMMRLELLLNNGEPREIESAFNAVERHRAAHFAMVTMPEPYYALASSALDLMGKRDASLVLLEEGLARHPESDMIMNSLAYTMALDGTNLPRAMRLIDNALKRDPENYAYLDTLGWVLYKTGDYDGALRSLGEALRLCDVDCYELYDHIGDVLSKLGRGAEAPAWWAKSYSIQRNPVVADKLQEAGIDPGRIP